MIKGDDHSRFIWNMSDNADSFVHMRIKKKKLASETRNWDCEGKFMLWNQKQTEIGAKFMKQEVFKS